MFPLIIEYEICRTIASLAWRIALNKYYFDWKDNTIVFKWRINDP